MSSSREDQARSSQYERGWALLYRLIRLNASLSGHERNVLYWNHGDGSFADLSAAAGLDFPEDGRAFATFDFDLDGDTDILVNNRNSPQLRLLRNNLPTSHHSVAFALEGTASNRDAVGARLELETESGRRLVRSVRSGSGFRSQPSRRVHFGLESEDRIRELRIFWPSGRMDRHRRVPADHFVVVKESSTEITARPFEDSSPRTPVPRLAAPEVSTSQTGIWLTEATPAPALRGESLDGAEFEPDAYLGKRVLLNFWATWCAPCKVEVADFIEHRAELERASLVPLLVSVDELSEREAVHRFVANQEVPFPVVLPRKDSVTAYDLLVRHFLDQSAELAIPTSFLIDEAGRIVKLYMGRTSAEQILSDVDNWPQTGTDMLERALPFPGRAYVTRFERNWVQLSDAYAAAGFHDEALATLESAVQSHPEHAAILDRLGSLYSEQRRWEEALAAHRKALDLGLPGIAAKVHIASALAELDRLGEAAAVAKEALEEAPEDTAALRVWGAVSARQGRFETALPALLAAARIDPENPETHYNLGWLFMHTGQAKRAAESLNQAVKLAPDHVQALHDLGILHAQAESWDQASTSLRKAVEVRPDFPEAHYSLGLVHAQQGDYERAEDSLQTALKLREDYPEALADLGGVYIETRRYQEALPLLAKAQKLRPRLAQPYLNAVRAHVALGDRASALASVDALLKVHPNDPTAIALRKRLAQ